MKKITSLLITITMHVTMCFAQAGQDFASKFMQQCNEDTAVQCITVSPKMMEKLTKQAGANHNETIAQAIQKLKSARIVTASTNGNEYFHMAEELLKKNRQRFSRDKDYRNGNHHGTFYTRKTKNGDTVELIMLHTDTVKGNTVIVNLTGDIDNDFISHLTKTFSERTGTIKE